MTTPVSQCTVFIQVWIDTNAVQAGSTKGIYMVDNRNSRGSQKEGSGALQTSCTMNANICWMVLPIDPNFTAAGGMVQMQSIGNSNAWGPSGQPQRIDNTTFTGTAQNAGNASYNMGINVQLPGQSGMTLNLNPAVSVN